MFCPNCHFQNDPMSVHCMQCRTVLIKRSVQDPSEQKSSSPSSTNAKFNVTGAIASLIGLVMGLYAGIVALVPSVAAAAGDQARQADPVGVLAGDQRTSRACGVDACRRSNCRCLGFNHW